MTIYLSDRTGASIDTVLDNADNSNKNIIGPLLTTFDLDSVLETRVKFCAAGSANAPTAGENYIVDTIGASFTGPTNNRVMQYAYDYSTGTTAFLRSNNSAWSAWKEIYLTGGNKTNAQIDTVIDNADAGNIGKLIPKSAIDFDTINSGFSFANTSATNGPVSSNIAVMTILDDGTRGFQLSSSESGIFSARNKSGGTYSAWQELYHTGNTGAAKFGSSSLPTAGALDEVLVSPVVGGALNAIAHNATVATLRTQVYYYNPNGLVGSIATNGTATAYNTSSDPRLKDFSAAPSDTDIDSKFNDLFGAFRTFNWKSDPTGDLVWGFDAHATIDAGLDVGSEGEGPRELALGDVYNTTPAVFEDQEQQVVYKTGDKKGELKFYADGEPVMETISVEVTAAIEHKVSPAGVDQSKAVPILLAKIEQLERRLVAAGI